MAASMWGGSSRSKRSTARPLQAGITGQREQAGQRSSSIIGAGLPAEGDRTCQAASAVKASASAARRVSMRAMTSRSRSSASMIR